jgi:hypothetical protein
MTVHWIEGVADHSVDIGARLATDVRLYEAIALRRCAMYRTAFRAAAVGYPAEAMRVDAIAGWMRRQGVTVDVACVDDLDWTAVAGIHPSHIVMHELDEVSGPLALGYGVSRVIVDSAAQMAILCTSGTRPQCVLLDVTDGHVDEAMIADRRVRLDGLHYVTDGADIAGLAEILFGMIAEMTLISRRRAEVMSRLSVGDVDLTDMDDDPRSLRRVAETIDEIVEEACVRFRYPRPALTISPRPSTLLPAA